jgi:ABC-type siderophore export system fused ATPase/permease subunit
MRVALIAAAVGVVLLGIIPGQLLEAAEKSAATLVPAAANVLTLRP